MAHYNLNGWGFISFCCGIILDNKSIIIWLNTRCDRTDINIDKGTLYADKLNQLLNKVIPGVIPTIFIEFIYIIKVNIIINVPNLFRIIGVEKVE